MRSLAYLIILGLCLNESNLSKGENPVAIGQQRELFIDDHLIQTTDGITFKLNQATPREVILVTDQPWEGNTCAYYTIFQDGDKYRM